MALIQKLGEMKQKEIVKQFEFWCCEDVEAVEDLIDTIGAELFIEALNTGLEAVARKRARSNSDPKLSDGQLVQIRRLNDLIAAGAISYEEAFDLLVDRNGMDPALVAANLEKGD